MSESQAPQDEFRCPQCGCNELAGNDGDNATERAEPIVCGRRSCGWHGTWSDVLAARQGAEQEARFDEACKRDYDALARRLGQTADANDRQRDMIASLEQQLAAVTAERDRLAAEGVMLRNALTEDRPNNYAPLFRFLGEIVDLTPTDIRATAVVIWNRARTHAAHLRKTLDNSPATAAEAERVRQKDKALTKLLHRLQGVIAADEAMCDDSVLRQSVKDELAKCEQALASLDAAKGGA